jgi:curli biogenesis system outer membrane secretion channel CsgG
MRQMFREDCVRTEVISLFAGLLLFTSCATVKPPKVETVPNTGPSVSPVIAARMERSLKRKVAIARFSNETKYGQGFFYDKNDDRLGKQCMDILSAKLSATGKFIMLERSDLAQLSQEKQLSDLKSLNIPADYLIVGSVSEFGRKATSDVGVFSRTKKQTAYAKVNIRLVDVRTSQIIYSEEGAGEATTETETVLGAGSTADYDATLNDKVISAAIGKLVSNITENLLDRPWRSYILSMEGENYFIAGGEQQGIKEGAEFVVYKRGQTVNNPQTGIPIELPGKKVGTIKVVSVIAGDVLSELSVCKTITGTMPSTDFIDYYVQEK